MAIKDKVKKYVKKVLPFLILLVPFTASATRVNITYTGLFNSSQISKSLYINYEEGVTSVSIDENGNPVYDHIFSFFLEVRQFTGNQSGVYVSGLLRPYIKFNLVSSGYISSYIEAPFYTEDNISASVEFTSINASQARFDVITTLDRYYLDTSLPLLQFNYHIVTDSTVIPALTNFELDYSSSSGNFFRLSTQDDLSTIIADAINNSSDIDSIISILSHISSQTDLLNQVLTKVTNIDLLLSQVLTYTTSIDTVTTNQYTLMQRLYMMISGLTTYNPGFAIGQDIEQFKQYWTSIISDALEDAELVSDGDQIRADLQNQEVQTIESQVHSLESGYFQDYNSAANNITWNPVAPARVVSIAAWVISFLDALYNKLDSIKFLITVSLTMGILILVLGSALRYYRRGR